MVTVLTDAQTRSTALLADSTAVPNAQLFARTQLAEWGLAQPQLMSDACAGMTQLLMWALTNGAGILVEITLVWDGPLLFTEISDRAEQIPHRPLWRHQDGRAVAILEAASVEWGAEAGPRGRCLWASFHTGRPELPPREPR
jgi:hypothetical protein